MGRWKRWGGREGKENKDGEGMEQDGEGKRERMMGREEVVMGRDGTG